MTDLNHKYKDRDPLETVQIVKDFFESNGFTIEEEVNSISEIGTYWCHISLLYNGIKIMNSNGKGTSFEYALASGYSELYERCLTGFGTFKEDLLLNYKRVNINFNRHGYYEHPEEKFVSFDEIRNCCNKFKEYYSIVQDKNNYFLKTFNLFLDKKPFDKNNESLVVPYEDFNHPGERKFFSPLIIRNAQGSSGMASGNTLEEALTQGLSECYEHYVKDQIYRNRKSIYYELNIDKLNISNQVKEYISKIKELNYNIHILDMSYSYGVPVILTILIDKNNKVWYVNLASNPVIDVAIERTITEIYQGTKTIKGAFSKPFMVPSRGFTHRDVMKEFPNCCQEIAFYPEELLINKILVNDYNKEMFLSSGNYSNIYLNDYMRDINKKNGFNVYYYNHSVMDEMYAIQIVIDNIEIYDVSPLEISNPQMTETIGEQIYEIAKICLDLLNEKEIDTNRLLFLLNEEKKFQPDRLKIFPCVFHFLFVTTDNLSYFYQSLMPIYFEIKKYYNIQLDEFAYYNSLFLYKNNNYSDEETYNILKILGFNVENTLNDLQSRNYLKPEYMFENLILPTFRKLYNSKEYENIMSIYVKK